MAMFFVIVIGVWILLHVYVSVRLVQPLRFGRTVKSLAYLLAVALAVLGPLVFVADRLLVYPYSSSLRWLCWTYVGAFTVLFALLLARDLLLLVLRLGHRRAEASDRPASEDRRRFLLTASSGGALGATGVLTSLGVAEARKVPAVVEVEVPIAGLPAAFDGYRIVQLSDLHVGETIDKDFILPIVEQVTSLKPDLVAVTGDIVDGSVDALRADISLLAYLRARDHVLCVTGNHEYYSGVEPWCAHFRELGMTVLNNAHVLVARGDKKLLVAGVTDYREGARHPGHRSDPGAALKGAPAHDVRILLAHQPRSAFAASEHGYALQLSGHTHGGQFFPWNLFVGLVQRPVVSGLGRYRDMWVYVSRGTCYWGPPLRTFVPAEITLLKLQRA